MAEGYPPITTYIPRLGPRYQHIRYPTFAQLLQAAFTWDYIAGQHGLEYAFVGSIVARLRCDGFEVDAIEILVNPSTLEDDRQVLTEIKNRWPEYLGITPTNQYIIVVDGNRMGITLQFFATGTENYPSEFIPPYDAPQRSTQYGDQEPTFDHMPLRPFTPCEKWVPFICCRHLLYQRLLRFIPHPQDKEQKDQNRRGINDIKSYLKCTARDKDPPFPNDVAGDLLPTVGEWIRYADNNFHPFTWDAKKEWRRLGFDV